MADIKNFRDYIDELLGIGELRKKIAHLEQADSKNEGVIKELKEEIKLLKKQKAADIPEKIVAVQKKAAAVRKKTVATPKKVAAVTKKAVATPKKAGRKPRTMIQVIEDEMAKKKNKTMKVTDIVEMLKAKKVKLKSQKPYSSVMASLSKNKKFERVGPGEFGLVGESVVGKPTKKAAGKKKISSGKK